MYDAALLPPADTEEQYEAVWRDEACLRPGVTALCDHLGRRGGSITRFADGSLPVYAVGDRHVLKLYPHVYRHRHEVESRVLQTIDGRLPIPTPRVERSGDVEGWSYVLMSRLHGESLAAAWPRIPPGRQARLAADLGEALAALHAVASPALDALGPPDWGHFIARQRSACVQHQRERGLDEKWLAQIPAFLDDVDLAPPPRGVLLHTEVMREHLLVTPTPDGWSLSGLFDFEPAMRGAPEYEFASVGLFVSRGDPGLLRRLLTAYGYPQGRLDDALSRRLLAYTLLHRYSDLTWYLEQLPPPTVPTLPALAACWWGLQ
jgi:hygromycin-B 7''-O-kinase